MSKEELAVQETMFGVQSETPNFQSWRLAYPMRPGTGPKNETCKTCQHYTRKLLSKAYLKCGLMVPAWTGGKASDIKASSPACGKWEQAK